MSTITSAWSSSASSISSASDSANYVKVNNDSCWSTNLNISTISAQDKYGLSVDEKSMNIKCEDGESRNLREYMLWALKGFPKKIEPMKTPVVTESEMLI